MKVSLGILFLVLLQPHRANAQLPLPAGRTTVVHLEAGYSYADLSIPSLGRLSMDGIDFGVTLDLSRHFAVDLAGSYARGPHVPVASQATDLLTYAAGVAVYPLETRHVSIRVRCLFGGARQAGANLGNHGDLLTGFVNHTAWVGGGALDYKLDSSWSIRFSADYLRSSFFNPAGNLVPQNNLRTGVGIVYTLGVSRPRSRR